MMVATKQAEPCRRAARKSLADQIDRLDAILDGLSGALEEAVADAVRSAVSGAVREALAKQGAPRRGGGVLASLTKPAEACRRLLTALLARLSAWALSVCILVQSAVSVARERVRDGVRSAVRRVLGVYRLWLGLWYFRRSVVVSAGIGITAGLLAYVAGPVVAAVLCAAGAGSTSLLSMLAGGVPCPLAFGTVTDPNRLVK